MHGQALLSAETWEELHSEGIIQQDIVFGGIRTEFTRGGVNRFRSYDDDVALERNFKSDRNGFYGWHGFGGSTFQWHVEKKVGFAYTPTRVTW